MTPQDPYARLAAPRRPAGNADLRPGRVALGAALLFALVALVAAAILPLGPSRGIEKLLHAPSVAPGEERR